ncbi:hypothetical protein [Parabacteroides sp. PF5-9]|uniref:hypothetical protein n=1 Tax=Parabacteroides sp. PF5-9 TaxID=1742404 RepID=UPI002475E028|nr:hypothetical protein [Parabacteroides sp. PF5-9]MDH6357370.1 septal ring factor EnvC (AmiA/AmiB activator) [Parabacteroides sp. PF5-9]
MKKVILAAFICSTSILFAQQSTENTLIEKIPGIQQHIEQLTSEVNSQKVLIEKQRNTIKELQQNTGKLEEQIKQLNLFVEQNKQQISGVSNNLEKQIKESEEKATQSISQLGGDLQKNRLYWIIATLAILLLGTLMYFFLKKHIKSSQDDVETQIRNTKKSLDDEGLRLDNKLIEVLESQLKVQQEESKGGTTSGTKNIDHSLALKVADEIARMQKNISRMDDDTKGLKPLEKGIERIQANFAANGYEMVNLLNVDYDERMNIDVINFIENDSLPEGKKMITKIIKPQVNYNGILIQRAQVEVSQN